MVLQPRGCGRVGRRRTNIVRVGPPSGGPTFAFPGPVVTRDAAHRLDVAAIVHRTASATSLSTGRPGPTGCRRCATRLRRRRCTVTTTQRTHRREKGPVEAEAPSTRSGWWAGSGRLSRPARSSSEWRRAHDVPDLGAAASPDGRGGRRAEGGLGAVHGVDPAAASEHRHVACRRPRRGERVRCGAGSSRLAVRRVPGRGGGVGRADHASFIGRMRTPRLGFGWNEVAFSGRSPPDSTIARTCVEVGAGQQHRRRGGAASLRARRRRCGGARPSGAARRAGQHAVVQPRTAAARARSHGRRRATSCRRSARGGCCPGRPARAVGRAAATSAPAPRAASASCVSVAPGRVRWIAPRNSGVSCWSTSIARPASHARPGCSCWSRR